MIFLQPVASGLAGLSGHPAGRNSEPLTNEGNGEKENAQRNHHQTVQGGITFGSALAMVISYVNWHSVGWAIFHGLLSWVYVIYYLIRY